MDCERSYDGGGELVQERSLGGDWVVLDAGRWLSLVDGGGLALLGGDFDLRSLNAVSVCKGLRLVGGCGLSSLGVVGRCRSLGALSG